MSNPQGINQYTKGQSQARAEKRAALKLFGGGTARRARYVQHAASIRHNKEFKAQFGSSSYLKSR